MTHDTVIKGGTRDRRHGCTAVDRPTSAIDGDRIAEIGERPRGHDRARRVGSGRRTRLHRHPHALRRAGVLGPRAHTVVVARRDDRSSPGNCGFSIAPCRPEHRELIGRTLQHVEDMSLPTLQAGIPWDFETFPEYLDSVARHGNDAQLHRVHRAHRAAALRDGRRRLRARAAHRRRARADGRRRRARPSRPVRPASRPAPRRRTTATAAGRCRRASPTSTRWRRSSVRCSELGRGRRRVHARRARDASRDLRRCSAASGARSPGPRCSRSRAHRSPRTWPR